MSASQINPQFASLYASLFNYNQWASGVIDLDRGWSKPLAMFDAMNASSSFGISGPEGKLIVLTQPRQEVVQQVLTATQSGSNLILTWADPTYTGFRNKDIIMDDKNYKAQVVSNNPGTVTIQPVAGTTTLTAGTHFAVGTWVSCLFDASGNLASPVGKENLYKERVPRYNYTALSRESFTAARREKFNTLMGPDGVAYYWSTGETQMVNRFVRKTLNKYIFSDPGVFTSQLEGVTNTTQGLRAAIRDQGGMFVSSPSLLSQTQFESYLTFLATKDPAQNQDYLFWGGREAWGRISSFYQNDIIYTVSTKIVGGQSVNFDIQQVTIKGVTIKIMVGSIFDDNVMFPALSSISGATGTKMSNTFCLLNLNPVPDADTGMMIPSCRKFHWDTTGRGQYETIYKMIGGMTGAGQGNDTGPTVYNNYQMTSTPVDGFAVEMEADNGIDFTADGCVWFELSA
jgi:hypothetical protein